MSLTSWFTDVASALHSPSRRSLKERFSTSSLQPLEQRVVPTHLHALPHAIEAPAQPADKVDHHAAEGASHKNAPHKVKFASGDVTITLSNSTNDTLTLGIAKSTKKSIDGTFPVVKQKDVNPGKSIRIHTAVIYDPNDLSKDFAVRVNHGNTEVLQKQFVILSDTVPENPNGDLINPKVQQIDIAVLPGNDIRISVNPKS
ncbi:MAG: hypothetical protein U0903_02440 [Planctomycetales bacterium]